MKKRFFYFSLLLLFIAVSAFAVISFSKTTHREETVYSELLPRKNSIDYAAEWAVIKNNAVVLQEKIKRNPADIKSLLALTALYIQESRNTGNFNYYNDAALKCINAVLLKEPQNFEALTFKATVLLSQHRFTEGPNRWER